jgi:predicted Zn-dependent protease
MQTMRLPGQPRPYYGSVLIRDERAWTLQAKYGSLSIETDERKRNAYVDIRVGSYRNDQVREGGLEDNDKEAESFGFIELPYGAGDGLRHGLWRLIDSRYREAVEALLEKRSHQLTYRDGNRELQAFERAEPIVDLEAQPLPEVDVERWRDYVLQASKKLKSFPELADSYVEFQADHLRRTFVNSEGSRIVQSQSFWTVEAYLWMLSPRGDAFPWSVRQMVCDPTELPDIASLMRDVRAAMKQLQALAEAPMLNAYCGPALLEPIPAGLLLHEALGHRLEGHRLLASGEGQTFKGVIGERVIPEFLTLHDDPSHALYGQHSLVGHYRYDDEGSPAADANLIERGVLRGYLTGRTGVTKRHQNNGHARSRGHQRPISRMGVLIAEAHERHSAAELKKLLLEEIKRQGVPFGIRIIEASSGETATDAYNFQAFMGEVNLAAKVYPDGREEFVRGVNFVGTPLNVVRGIIAAGDQVAVDNAWCGAESGYIPVSTVSPALLVSELELQSKPDTPYAPYTFPIPWKR